MVRFPKWFVFVVSSLLASWRHDTVRFLFLIGVSFLSFTAIGQNHSAGESEPDNSGLHRDVTEGRTGKVPGYKKRRHFSECVGTYVFLNHEAMYRQAISLHQDGTFDYMISNDLFDKSSKGKYDRAGDTIFLTSEHQLHNIGIKATEYVGGSDTMFIGAVTNKKGDVIPTAIIYINGDTSRWCDPLQGSCRFKKGEVQSVNVLAGRTISVAYTVKDSRAERIALVLDVEGSLFDYLFLYRKKLVIKQGALFPIRDNRIDSTYGPGGRDVPVALRRQ